SRPCSSKSATIGRLIRGGPATRSMTKPAGSVKVWPSNSTVLIGRVGRPPTSAHEPARHTRTAARDTRYMRGSSRAVSLGCQVKDQLAVGLALEGMDLVPPQTQLPCLRQGLLGGLALAHRQPRLGQVEIAVGGGPGAHGVAEVLQRLVEAPGDQ